MMPKFRAWDEVIDQMFIPDSIHFDSKGMVDGIGSKKTVFGIEDFELMQSTGLHDKNGKEIFEGDIVKNSYGEIGYIKHSIYTFVFAKKKECEWREFYLHGIGAGSPFEVLGNIHEHPELLEGDGE